MSEQPVFDAGTQELVAKADQRDNGHRVLFDHEYKLRIDLIAQSIDTIVRALGYDPQNQHFDRTPERVARWLLEFENRTDEPIDQILGVQFTDKYDELVLVTYVPFVAMCAHHMLTFAGHAHIGYVAQGQIVGLSKLARALEHFAHRLTVQEEITDQLVDALMFHLSPKGAMVVLQSEHDCMNIRGVKASGALTVTSGVRGCFLDNSKGSKNEMLSLIEIASRSR